MMRDLSRLLRPRSIAVMGGVWAEEVIKQCKKMNYAGELWAVHPRRRRMAGVPCVRSVAALPTAPDAAFIGVNRVASVEAVQAFAERGAGGVVCFASGFAEAGGSALQTRLVAAAGEMPMLGPNCYGVVNYLDGVALWPDQHGGCRTQRGVAVIGQSSNIMMNLSSQRRGLPLSYLFAVGNQAQCGMADIARGLLRDKRVSAIGFYLESVGNAADFADMAAQAAARGVPLVVLSSGKSRQAQLATASHTAALAADGQLASAFFRRCGVAEVSRLSEFIETLKLLHVHGALNGTRLVSMSCSGGEAALAADFAARRGMRFLPFLPRQKSALKKILGPRVRVANPLDYHTYIWHDKEALRRTFAAATRGGRHDCAFLLLDFPRADRCSRRSWDAPLAAFIEGAGKKCAVIATFSENMPEEVAEKLFAAGIAPLCGLEDGMSAVQAAASIGGKPDCLRGWRPLPARAAAAAGGRGVLIDEWESKQLLAANGIETPRGRKISRSDLSAAVLRSLGIRRAVVKTLGMAHKTEAGAVVLNVSAATLSRVAAAMPAGDLLIEEQIENPVAELLVGVRRCRMYGAALTIGIGGTQAELLADTQTLLLPATAADIRRALGRLTLAPLLNGWRGQAAMDKRVAARAAAAIARLLLRAPSLLEIEINPLIITADGRAVAADALITKT